MKNRAIEISISKEQVAKMPTVGFDGAITLIDRPGDVSAAVSYLRKQPMVGFDTETKPNFRKGMTNKVSLIQVATEEQSFLFRLNKIGFREEIKAFLECEDVVKIGLSLKDDFHVLHKVSPFTPGGFVDLQDVVKKYHISDASLQKIYAILFGERISKSQRLTNWEAAQLTPQQMVYASIDAWACLRIYRMLNEGRFDPFTSPYIVTPENTE